MAKSIKRLSVSCHSLPAGSKPKDGAPDEYWKPVQRGLYARVRIRGSNRSRAKTKIDVYIDNLQHAARQGDLNAVRESDAIGEYLHKNGILNEPEVRSAGSLMIQRRIDDHAPQPKFAGGLLSLSYAMLVRKLKSEYELIHGRPPDVSFRKPYYVEDPEKGERYLREARKAIAKKKASGDTAVGYCKTPVATRWKKNQSGNPSGKPKVLDDGWEHYREGLMRRIPVIKEGRQTKLTSPAIIATRVCDLAIKGDPRARREMRRMLIALHERGLLKPPAPRPRRKRARPLPDRRHMDLMEIYVRLGMVRCSYDMQDDYGKVYGPGGNLHEILEQVRQELLAEAAVLRVALKEPG